MATTQEFIGGGTETHGFGIADKNGREVGAKVLQGLAVYTESEEGKFNVKAGSYLTAYVFASRGGKDFCPLSGASKHFEITDGRESDALVARDRWVAEKIEASRQRAIKNFA